MYYLSTNLDVFWLIRRGYQTYKVFGNLVGSGVVSYRL